MVFDPIQFYSIRLDPFFTGPQDLREGKSRKLALFAWKKDQQIRIFITFHMKLRQGYIFLLVVHPSSLYDFWVA